jgi:hypothetical protein
MYCGRLQQRGWAWKPEAAGGAPAFGAAVGDGRRAELLGADAAGEAGAGGVVAAELEAVLRVREVALLGSPVAGLVEDDGAAGFRAAVVGRSG